MATNKLTAAGLGLAFLVGACATNPNNFARSQYSEAQAFAVIEGAIEAVNKRTKDDSMNCRLDDDLGFLTIKAAFFCHNCIDTSERYLLLFEDSAYEINEYGPNSYDVSIEPYGSGHPAVYCSLGILSERYTGQVISALETIGVKPNKAPLGYAPPLPDWSS